jgi:membrane protein DedA with SNARE-associated domain
MDEMLSDLATYGYIFLFLYSLGGGFVALMAAGVLSYAGKMDLTTSIAVAFVANAIGDTLLFYMARYQKADIMGYMHKHRRKLAYSHLLMKKYGSWIIVFQKFVYGIKTLIPLAIGLTRYNFTKFNILNVIAAAVWAIVVGVGSYMAGDALTKAYEVVAERPYIAPIILFTAVGSLWFFLSKATKKR